MSHARPKIGVVVIGYHPYGGAERGAFETTERVAASGRYEVHVLAHKFGEQVHPAIRCHTIPRFPFTHIGKVLSYTWMAIWMARRARFDVVHTHDRLLNQDIATLAGGCHAAYLQTILAQIEDPKRRASERRKIRHRLALSIEARQFAPGHYHTFFAVSKMVQQEVVGLYNVPESRVRVVPYGVNFEEFSPSLRTRYRKPIRAEFALQEHDVVALYVGNGYERKGLKDLLTAFAQSRGDAQRLHLLVVGRGHVQRYQALAQKWGIADRVIFAGARQDVNRFYAAADFLCLPTYYDPCALVVLEAMASGLPVITTHSNGAAEFITTGENGYVIAHAADTPALVQTLEILSNKASCECMGRAACPAIEGRSWERVTAETMNVYEEIVASKKTSA
jgi:UDP-glucose:(heptosyl)LPS alpha-1,3-glucosyltransferase